MNDSTILSILKIDLKISANSYDTYLERLISLASSAISAEGISLDQDNINDNMLIAQYAAWLYRKRDEDVGLPRYLRWQLNNRLISEKGR